jgi:hypothetical protein
MTLSAHKKFLVNVVEAEEDGSLLTIHGEIPILKGQLIAHDQFGGASVMPREYYERNYIPVQKVKKTVDKEQMALSYTQNWSNFEDNEYINDFQNKVKERNN